MGSTQSFTSTSPGHYRKSTGDDEHLEGVRLGDQGHVDNQNKNSVSDSHTHQQQQYGGTEPTIITEEAFAALQAELTKREEKLIEYEFEYSKIRGKPANCGKMPPTRGSYFIPTERRINGRKIYWIASSGGTSSHTQGRLA